MRAIALYKARLSMHYENIEFIRKVRKNLKHQYIHSLIPLKFFPMKKLKILLVAIFTLVYGLAYGQNITVRGVVTDASNGETLPGAAILVRGTADGVVADSYGNYTIEVPANATLEFSTIGFKSAEVAVNGRTLINVALEPDVESLEDVIVVAYGTSKKTAFTGSAGTVKSELIETRQVSNVSEALSGAIAGVQVQSANGQPGTSSTIRIRGVGSINANSTPLYVVDGVPFEGELSSINTHDIESMTVLKDAASSALYGARGANGVIMITTKHGKEGKAVVNFDMKLGVNQRAVPNYDVIDSPALYTEKTYEALYNAAYYTMGKSAYDSFLYANSTLPTNKNGGLGYQIYTIPQGQYLIGQNGKLNPNASLGYSDGQYYYTPDNWADETYKNKLRQEYNLSVSGGTSKLNYFASFGYLDDQGIIDNSGYTRYSFRTRAEYDAFKWLKFGGIVSYSNNNSTYPSEQTTTNSSGNAFMMANTIAPVYPMFVREANGNKLIDSRGMLVYDYGDGVSTNFNRAFMSIANPVGSLLYDVENYKMDIFSTNWFATITPIAGLTITGRIGLDIDHTRYTSMGNAYYGQSANYGGTISQENAHSQGLDTQLIAQYVHTFADKHNIDVMVGYDGYEYKSDNIWGNAQNLYNPIIPVLSNAIDSKNTGGSNSAYSTVGFVARANYDFDNRYFISASFRRDGSSRFSSDNRWGNFWSASAAWVMNNEEWLKSADWISFLKLKASYGENGNDKIGNNYAYLDQYSMDGANGVFSDGTLVYKGNPDLTWEKQKSFNVGIEFDFWDGRLAGGLEYYQRTISDMLYYKPVGTSSGYSSIPMNVGSMRNSGIELTLSSDVIKKKNFIWNLNFNITYDKNKILSLHPDLKGEFIDGSRIYTEGESMYRMYLVKYAGVDPETGEALYWAKDETGAEVKTSDWSLASSSNKKATDNIKPPFYGGFGTSFSFYGVDISAQLSYQIGGQVYDNGYSGMMHCGSSSYAGRNWHSDILNSWSETNKNTNIPRVNASDKYTNSLSDRFLVDASYLSINNLTIGYTFPSKWMSKIKMSKIRIYCSADNVAFFSARQGLDSRQSYTAVTSSLYSPIRSISGGLNVTF